jgi:hypothetical protein
LLEPAEAGDHVLRLGDLQSGWPLNNWLPSAGVNLQSVPQLRYVRAQRDSRGVSGHIQRVHHLAVNIRSRRPGGAAVALDQLPRPR